VSAELERRCPICKRGRMEEDAIGAHCSRRYARSAPCDFEIGMCNSPADFDAQVERFRKARAATAATAVTSTRVADDELEQLIRDEGFVPSGGVLDRQATAALILRLALELKDARAAIEPIVEHARSVMRGRRR
jgi:hypothetical protein